MWRVAMRVVVVLGVVASASWAAAPSGRYTVGAETVKDNKTGLTWQRAVPPSTYTQPNAVSYCQGLSLGGFSVGWRLPTKKELETLVDPRTTSPSIDTTAFPGTPSAGFWSSTPYAGSSGYAWHVAFNYGTSSNNDTTNTNRVRCVR